MPGYRRPLRALEAFRVRCGEPEASKPGAEALAARLLTVPTHGLLTPIDRRIEGRLRELSGTRPRAKTRPA